jgi:hypothetical protein
LELGQPGFFKKQHRCQWNANQVNKRKNSRKRDQRGGKGRPYRVL